MELCRRGETKGEKTNAMFGNEFYEQSSEKEMAEPSRCVPKHGDLEQITEASM